MNGSVNECQFVTAEQWAARPSPEAQRLAEGDPAAVGAGLADACTCRDLTALCGTHYNRLTGKIEEPYSSRLDTEAGHIARRQTYG